MTRAELSVNNMKAMGWEEIIKGEEPLIKDIVYYIKDGFYRYLRCVKDLGDNYIKRDYRMCSTYDVTMVCEYLEVSLDNKKWFKVAKRYVPYSERCVWAE